MVPAQPMQLGDVGQLAHRAVRLGGIETDLAVARLIRILEIHPLHHEDGGVRHLLAPEELAQRLARAPQLDPIQINAVFIQDGQDSLFRGCPVHFLHWAFIQIGTDSRPITLAQALGQMDLADHSRQHVAVLQMEIIVRTIKIGRHHGDVVGAVLQVKTLAQLQAGDLGDRVRLVGVFQRRGQQRLLFHRLLRVAGIDAGATQEDQLLHSMPEALADHVLLDLQIPVDEVRPIAAVGHDAAHVRRRQDHVLRPLLVEEAPDSHAVQQVQLGVRPAHQVRIALLLKILIDGRAHQSAVARHIDFRVLVDHGPLS